MTEDNSNNEEEANIDVDLLSVGGLISLTEAAEKSGFSNHFLRRLAESKRLKARKIGRNWVTTMAAVDEYKNNRSLKNVPKKYRNRD